MNTTNNLHDLFSFIGLEDDDILTLLENNQGLYIKDINNIMKCIATVTSLGFPKSELSTLINANPTFLLSEPKIIRKKLLEVTGNIEIELLKNPYLI